MVNLIATEEKISEVHDEHEVSCVAFQTLVISIGVTEIALWATIWMGWIWLAIPPGLLRKSRRLNEFDGVIIGVFSFLPFSLYRVVHQTHHMHLASERDTELWPFVRTNAPRWARRLAALLELTLGLFYSPF